MRKSFWAKFYTGLKLGAAIVPFLLFIMLCASCNSWHEMWGDHPLGNHLSMLDGDCKEDRIIVYCGNRTGVCYTGIYVIPTYSRHYDSNGHYTEYVITAISDSKWVVAKTLEIKKEKENYWIIKKGFNIDRVDCSKVNCDSIIQSHVIGPLTLSEFIHKKEVSGINLLVER